MDHAVDCLSLLQEKSGRNRASSQFEHGSLGLKYRLDNEFELVFVAAYQVGKLVSNRLFLDAFSANCVFDFAETLSFCLDF